MLPSFSFTYSPLSGPNARPRGSGNEGRSEAGSVSYQAGFTLGGGGAVGGVPATGGGVARSGSVAGRCVRPRARTRPTATTATAGTASTARERRPPATDPRAIASRRSATTAADAGRL